MAEVGDAVKNAIYARVMRDLAPSPPTVWGKTGVSVVAGGVLSMLLCGQFGMGLTVFAREFSHVIHHQFSPAACALLCGVLFAVVPVLTLRLLCHPLQFRLIIRRRAFPLAVWLAAAAFLLGYHGDVGTDVLYLALWFAAAFTVFKLFGRAVDVLASLDAYGTIAGTRQP